MNVLSYPQNPDIARVYLVNNGIVGAFIWHYGPAEWQVLEGNPEKLTGFVAETLPTKREAQALADRINARIAELSAQEGGK